MSKKLIIPTALGTAFIAGMAIVPNQASAASGGDDCTAVKTGSTLTTCLTSDTHSATLAPGAKVEVASTISITNDATLDLGEGGNIVYTPASKNLFEVNQFSFDITGKGTIETTQDAPATSNQIVAVLFKGAKGKHLNIGQGVTLKGQTPLYFSSKSTGNATVDVSGTIEGKSGNDAAIFAPWNLTSAIAPTVTLHSSAKVQNIANGPAVSLGGYTNFTSDGALIEGSTGIGIGAGKLTLKGNTRIHANGAANVKFDSDTNTLPTYGAAIQVVHAEKFGKNKNMDFKGDVEIIIEDGEYTSENGSPIADLYDKDNHTEGSGIKSIQISGGTFTSKDGEPLVKSTDDEFSRTGFISGGKFISGNGSMDVPEEYIKDGLVEDPVTGKVMTEVAYQELVENRKPHYPCSPFPQCMFAYTEPDNTPSDPTGPSEPTEPSDPTDPGTSNNGNANNGNANNENANNGGNTGSGSIDDGVVNPNTADPIVAYAGLVVITLLGIGISASKLAKNNKLA